MRHTVVPILVAAYGRDARAVRVRLRGEYVEVGGVPALPPVPSDESYAARAAVLLRDRGVHAVAVAQVDQVWERMLANAPEICLAELLAAAALLGGRASAAVSSPVDVWAAMVAAARPSGEAVGPDDLATLRAIGSRLLDEGRPPPVGALERAWRLGVDELWTDPGLLRSELTGDRARVSFESEEQRREAAQSVAVPAIPELRAAIDFTVVVGEPGSGKTTLLRKLARDVIARPATDRLFVLPVALRRYAELGAQSTLLQFALEELGVADRDERQSLASWISEANADRRKAIVLLDGWDEIAHVPEKARIDSEIGVLAHVFATVLTTRPSADTAVLRPSRVFKLAELRGAASRSLVTRWHAAEGYDAAAADHVLDHLVRHPDLRQIARNPFLLVCLCVVAAGDCGGALPTTRTQLYDALFRTLRVPRSASEAWKVLRDEDLPALERLSYWLLAEADGAPRFEFTRGDIVLSLGRADAVDQAVERSPLLTADRWDSGSLRFLHATFQEHLASRHLVRASESGRVLAVLQRHLLDPTWREVFAFMAGSSKASPGLWMAVRRLVRDPDVFGLVFVHAARLVAEAGATDGGAALVGTDLRGELWERVRRGIAAGAFAAAAARLDPGWFVASVRRFLAGRRRGEADEADEKDTATTRALAEALLRVGTPDAEALLLEIAFDRVPDTAFLFNRAELLTREAIASVTAIAQDELAEPGRRSKAIRLLGLAGASSLLPWLAQVAAMDEEGVLGDAAADAIAAIDGEEALRHLADILDATASEVVRARAVRCLGEMRSGAGTARLMLEAARRDPHDPLLPDVLEALIEHPVHEQTDWFVRLLGHDMPESVREAAATLLGQPGNRGVAPALSMAARHVRSERVRVAALLSLGAYADFGARLWLEPIVDDPVESSAVREAALTALLECFTGHPAYRASGLACVRKWLQSDDETLRKTAIDASARYGADAVEDLCRILRASKLEGTTTHVLAELELIGDAAAADDIARVVRTHEFSTVRKVAARALGRLDPERLLAIENAEVRDALVWWCVDHGALVRTGPRGERELARPGRPSYATGEAPPPAPWVQSLHEQWGDLNARGRLELLSTALQAARSRLETPVAATPIEDSERWPLEPRRLETEVNVLFHVLLDRNADFARLVDEGATRQQFAAEFSATKVGAALKRSGRRPWSHNTVTKTLAYVSLLQLFPVADAERFREPRDPRARRP